MKQKLILLTGVLFLIGCQKKVSEKEVKTQLNTEIEFSLVGKGNLLGNANEGIDAGSMWITNEEAWNELVEKMNIHNRVSDSFIDSAIDFKTFDVIASFDEVRPHSGFVVKVEKLMDDQTNRIVFVVYYENNRGFEVASQPYYLIKMPKSEKTVMFQ